MRSVRTFAIALLTGAASLAAVLPATSAPLMSNNGLHQANPGLVENVQYRRWRGGGGYYRRGPGVGAVIGGLAAGAIIGGAIASSQAQAAAQQNAAYCSQRFRSYDPGSGTYLARDGNRYACP